MKKIIVVVAIIAVVILGRFVLLSQTASRTPQKPVPVISVMDILHASDLAQGIKQAVENNDDAAINQWLAKAVDVAKAAELGQDDIDYLQSRQAKEYVKFTARRALFNDAFEQRFYALEGIDDLKETYPEARDLFGNADNLIKKRDAIIESIAVTLAGGGEPTEQDRQQAREMWQQRYTEPTPAAVESTNPDRQ